MLEATSMKIAVDVESAIRRERGVLTDEHAAGFYRLPVLVIRGEPHGPLDLVFRFGADVKVRPAPRKMLTRSHGPVDDFLSRARQGGYDVGGPAEAWANQ
jgi:hypothetical protein